MSKKSSHLTNLMWGGRFSSKQDYIMDKIANINLRFEDVILTKNEQENIKFWNIRE